MVVEKADSGISEVVEHSQGLLLMNNLGTGYVWVGDFKLTKSEVTELITHLQAWVETGSLELQNLKGE